jgi:hypothetical protein
MSIKPRPGMLILGLFLIVIFFHPVIYALIWPDCSYESSDGKWWDHEIQIKGRGFNHMVALFELYKLRCEASSVKLVRTTCKNPLNIFAWRGYLKDEKWKIEYAIPSSKSREGSTSGTVGEPPCYRTAKVDLDQDVEAAHQATQKFIESLSSVKQPPLFGN